MSAEAGLAAIVFGGEGENALLEAGRLCRAGELAACAGSMDADDAEALASVYRAVAGRLEVVAAWMEAIRMQVVEPSTPADTDGSRTDGETEPSP